MSRERERGGMGLASRMALSIGLALALAAAGVGWLLVRESERAMEVGRERALEAAVELTADVGEWRYEGDLATRHGRVTRRDGLVKSEGGWTSVHVLEARPRGAGEQAAPARLFAPAQGSEASEFGRLVVAMLGGLVLLVAAVAAWVASRAARPLGDLVLQVRQIALGDMRYRSRVRSGGEVGLLARSLDRLAADLAQAQEARLELSVRQRELTVASEVREALIPLATPLVRGYDPGALHLASGELGGGFHDWLELPEGAVGLLVCDVSGSGLPAALVGSAARAYLRAELTRDGDLASAFARVNRDLARDVRRGMFITALYARLEPRTGAVRVVCAGHRIPLLHGSEGGKKLRLVQPEGIALGLDRGPVFERALAVAEFTLLPGERLVLAGSGPLEAADPNGEEFGEARFYQAVGRAMRLDTPRFLKSLKNELETHQAGTPLGADVSLLSVLRES